MITWSYIPCSIVYGHAVSSLPSFIFLLLQPFIIILKIHHIFISFLCNSLGCGKTRSAISSQVYSVFEDALVAKTKAEKDLQTLHMNMVRYGLIDFGWFFIFPFLLISFGFISSNLFFPFFCLVSFTLLHLISFHFISFVLFPFSFFLGLDYYSSWRS